MQSSEGPLPYPRLPLSPHQISPTTTEEEKKPDGLAGTVGPCCLHIQQRSRRRRKLAGPGSYSVVPLVAMNCTMLILDVSQHLDWESKYFSIYVWVFVCVPGSVCVVWFPSLMQSARETPNHPVFHLVLHLPHPFLHFLSSVSFSPFTLSAIWP